MWALLHDVRQAWRSLVRAKAFALVAVITIGLGVGANTAIFSAVRAVLLRPPPFADPDGLALIVATNAARGLDEMPVSYPNYEDLRASTSAFEDIAAWTSSGYTKFNLLTGEGEPESLQYGLVTSSFFDVLRVTPALGRGFEAAHDEPGSGAVVMLSDGLYRRRFAGDPSVIGRTIRLDDRAYTVVGVLPPTFAFTTLPRDADVWVPFGQDPVAGRRFARSINYVALVGRLRADATMQQAGADVARIGDDLAQRFPWEQEGESFRVVPLREMVTRELRPALLALMAAVGFVLLIACANVANLFLVRVGSRRRELAVHASLGAPRGALARGLLVESVVLALLGGAAGALLSLWLTDLLVLAPWGSRTPFLPWQVSPESVQVDTVALCFTIALSVVAGLAFGIVPALRGARVDLASVLRSASPGGAGERSGMRSTLVVVQTCLAFVLLCSAGLALQSFGRLLRTDTGFRTDGVLVMELRLPAARYRGQASITQFYDALIERAARAPAIEAVGLVDALPLSGIGQSTDFFIEGRAPTRLAEAPQTHYRSVSPGYFDVLRIELVRGRLPDADDVAGAPRIAVISESMARQFWPGEDPIGQRAALSLEAFVRFDVQAGRAVWDSAGALREIVGIVRDVRDGGPASAAQPQMYVPFAQRPDGNVMLVARTAGDPGDLTATLRADVAAIDADQPVASVTTLDQLANTTLARPRSNGIAFSLFAGLALLLATVGVYALLAWTVVARRHEIGVRLALGGPPSGILRSFVLHGLTLGAIGIALGLPLAFAAAWLMRGMLFGAAIIDPLTWAVAATALLAATTAACWIPGRRAASVDPASVMRSDSF